MARAEAVDVSQGQVVSRTWPVLERKPRRPSRKSKGLQSISYTTVDK